MTIAKGFEANKTTRQNIDNFNIRFNKFRIFWFDNEKQHSEKTCESGFVDAKNEIEALKKWHIHINAYYSKNSWFVNQTYEAIRLI